MAKREYLNRYLLIIRKLEKGPATFEEISDYLKSKSELQGDSFEISPRTFLRDRQEIVALYSINIEFNFRRRVYYIADEAQKDLGMRTLEAFEMFNALKMSESFAQFVDVAKPRPQGIEHFYTLLKSIKDRRMVRIQYQKFDHDEPEDLFLGPYALKEFEARWYLISAEVGPREIRICGLDRIKSLLVMPDKFSKPSPEWNVKEYFKDYYGIFRTTHTKAEKIVLSFSARQKPYIKTQPLHATQNIILENEGELRIELFLHITFDLIQKLLSYAEDVKVISPVRLRKEMMTRYKNALGRYVAK